MRRRSRKPEPLGEGVGGMALRAGTLLLVAAATTTVGGLARGPADARGASELPGGPDPEGSPSQEAALDTASLAEGPWSTMRTLLERTIFQVNVLELTVRLGPDPADRIEALAGARLPREVFEDSAARIGARATDALARLDFRRTVGLGRFAEAVRSNLDRAAADGYLSEGEARAIGDSIPRWFAFLGERPIREGDRIVYRIRGDTLRTLFLRADGERRLDQTDVGPEHRLAVLGSYFARESDFREGLLASLPSLPGSSAGKP